MKLEGLHHVTAICADAQRNVDFYARVLGLRLVKKTVNFDAPDVYHLYYGDEGGRPGSIMTFFEFPGARQGRAGAGMVHTVCWRVGSADALAFWEQRLGDEGVANVGRAEKVLRFDDPEGLRNALVVVDVPDEPLVARAGDVSEQHALRGFHGVRAYARDTSSTVPILEALGMETDQPDRWLAAGDTRRGQLRFDPAPDAPGVEGGGTVHHIAWSAADDDELAAWRDRVAAAGARPTTIIDRQYFHSVYFRTPMGVLFELATRDIGFEYDEPLSNLGEELRLPPQYEAMREQLVERLTPLRNPRVAGVSAAGAPGAAPGSLPHRVRPAAGEPEGALILTHGRGADEHDLFPLLDLLDPERRLLGVTPGGPLSMPPGGRHWYAVHRVGFPDPATFAHGFAALTGFLDGLGLDWSRTVLGGFSQGAVMSYATGLGEGRPLPAGIIALSGFVPTVEPWTLRLDLPAGFPVAIGHGTHDPVISVEFGRDARARLEGAGAGVVYDETGIGHTIDPRFLATLPAWVERVVPPRGVR